jgi:mannose-6-phosphate isomerase-like protein (cupin superfamily)
MLVNSESTCAQFTANDGCQIRELLHPKNDNIDLPFSLAVAEVEVGKCTYRHRLRQLEVYYIVAGTGIMHIGTEQHSVKPGDAVLVPANQTQWIENVGAQALKFAAIVAPAWCAEDDERL